MNQYQKLYTPEDSALVFIDQQPQMTFGMASADRATMINNVTLLARVAGLAFGSRFGRQPPDAAGRRPSEWRRRSRVDPLSRTRQLSQSSGTDGRGRSDRLEAPHGVAHASVAEQGGPAGVSTGVHSSRTGGSYARLADRHGWVPHPC